MNNGAKGNGRGNGPARLLTVSQDAPVAAAAALMRDHNVGCLVVTGPDGRLAGVITERDLVGQLGDPDADLSARTVGQVMTVDVAFCPPGTPMAAVREIMAQRHVRHLPIVANGVPVGMISTRDIMAHELAKDRAMRSAAEQVARLSTCLKSLDFEEVVGMIAREVPRVFQARKSVLCFPEDAPSGETSLKVHRSKCPCPDRDLRQRPDTRTVPEGSQAMLLDCPEVCRKLGGGGPNLVIPLHVRTPHHQASWTEVVCPGYLCMCDFDPAGDTSEELLQYESALLQDILSANLVNARLYQEYQDAKRKSLTDELTGVGSRRLFEEKLEAECARAARYQRPFCIAIVDVDHFKEINDHLGHAGGDRALVDLGACMSREKRSSDVLARYGGDEFILLLPETRLDEAVVLLERIRDRVVGVIRNEGLQVTISGGVVEQDLSLNASPNELIRRADLALYQAKNSGRNRIQCWEHMSKDLHYSTYTDSREVSDLKERVAGLLQQSKELFLQSVYGLVKALEARDAFTRSHSDNVTRYAVGIAEALGIEPQQIAVLRTAAMIHDVGKIGVPDAILCKPGKLDAEERRVMEQHPVIACRILDQMRFLEREIPIVRHHHERWDGQGYPDGVSGRAIELGARILAVADAFDAITSNRTYHRQKNLPEAMAVLAEAAGSQFDPDVVRAMTDWVRRLEQEFQKPGPLTCQELLGSQQARLLVA